MQVSSSTEEIRGGRGNPSIRLMNDVGYNLAMPGNHEFDYGVGYAPDFFGGFPQGAVIIDVDAVAQYLSTMGEKVSDEYADRYGQERIHFVSE